MKKTTLLCLLLIYLSVYPPIYSALPSKLDGSLNLEEASQDFVLETKQLKIPGYPTASNPSIARWGNALVLSFIAYSGDNAVPDQMGLVWLDNDFNAIGNPHILPIKCSWQDPRLISIKDRLYIIYNGALESGVRRTFFAEVHNNDAQLSIDLSECFLYFAGMDDRRAERNWAPFAYLDTLMLTYSIVPHLILCPLMGTQSCEDIASTPSLFDWDWGDPRPGTTAYLDGDRYLAFFHSSKVVATVHSEKKPIHHYFMGAYTFDRRPPFALSEVSASPIIGRDFYHGPEYKTVKPLRVVFPCGFVLDDHYVWVVYGKQDHEAWVVKLDKKRLYDSLVPVTQILFSP